MRTTKSTYLLLTASLIAFSFCNTHKDKTKPTKQVKQEVKTITTIHLQPFADIDYKEVNYVYAHLKNYYPYLQINDKVELPSFAYYQPRERYRADSLLTFLQTLTQKNQVIIGLTNKDISATKGKYEDYGIMGLGSCPGTVCVVSLFRPKTSNQFFKVAIHELGHTQGLLHCPVDTCFMRDAEGKNTTDMETNFCGNCKKVLVSKGWIFKQ